jgi:hypothetical protein
VTLKPIGGGEQTLGKKTKRSASGKKKKRSNPTELPERNMPGDFLRGVKKKGRADSRHSSDRIHDLLRS